MKAFVIAIIGLPLSERGASRCIEAAKQFDLNVELFPATTRYEAESALRAEGLTIDRRVYDRISDEPIGDRDKVKKGRWHLTTPEVGCFLSHYHLWKRSSDLDEPVIVFEHDVWPIARPPSMIPTVLALSLEAFGRSRTIGYIIAPAGARILIEEAKKGGIQPSDEMLWRTALLPRQMAYCNPSVIAFEDRRISTIQFTRSDQIHEEIEKIDPWDDYVPPRR